jgi:uncharacterized protein YjhX (UPF0386 family)
MYVSTRGRRAVTRDHALRYQAIRCARRLGLVAKRRNVGVERKWRRRRSAQKETEGAFVACRTGVKVGFGWTQPGGEALGGKLEA